MSSATFFKILGACVPQALKAEFQFHLATYTFVKDGALRSSAFRGMVRILARGFSQLAINAVMAIARPIMMAAGAIASAVATVMQYLAAGAAAVLESPIVLGLLIAALLAIIVYFFYNLWHDWSQRRDLEQNMELDRNTRKLFGAAPVNISMLMNNPNTGPVAAINQGRLQVAV